MHSVLSEEQQALRDVTRAFLAKSGGIGHVRMLQSSGQAVDRSWWSKACDLGWLSIVFEEDGHTPRPALADLAVVAAELGRQVAPAPLVPSVVMLLALATAPGDRRNGWLESVASGASLCAWCVTEPRLSGDHDEDGTVVAARGDDLCLTGRKTLVEFAAVADLLLVSATWDSRPCSVVLPADTPGVHIEARASIDLVRPVADVTFTDVVVAPHQIVAVGNDAHVLHEQQRLHAWVMQCAEMVGAVERSLELTLEYMAQRYSFGRPLTSYQALKHRVADAKLWVEACAAITTSAAQAVDQAAADAANLASVAKAYVGERAPAVVQECIQLHGGIGVTWEHDLHLYLRRVVLDGTVHGSPVEHRQRLAERVVGR